MLFYSCIDDVTVKYCKFNSFLLFLFHIKSLSVRHMEAFIVKQQLQQMQLF